MRWLNPLRCNQRVALLERARFCQRHAMTLLRIARSSRPELAPVASAFREAAAIHFRRRDEHLAAARALTPRSRRRV